MGVDIRDGRYWYGPIYTKDEKYAVQQAEQNEARRAVWRVRSRLRPNPVQRYRIEIWHTSKGDIEVGIPVL